MPPPRRNHWAPPSAHDSAVERGSRGRGRPPRGRLGPGHFFLFKLLLQERLELAHGPTAPAFARGRHQHQRPAAVHVSSRRLSTTERNLSCSLRPSDCSLVKPLNVTTRSAGSCNRAICNLRRLLRRLLRRRLLRRRLLDLFLRSSPQAWKLRANCCRLLPSHLAMAAPSLRATSM